MPVCFYKYVHSTIVWKPNSFMKHTMSLVGMKWHATRTLKNDNIKMDNGSSCWKNDDFLSKFYPLECEVK